jgi:hypothetical protein
MQVETALAPGIFHFKRYAAIVGAALTLAMAGNATANTLLVDMFDVGDILSGPDTWQPGFGYGYEIDTPVSDMTFNCCRSRSIESQYYIQGDLGHTRTLTMRETLDNSHGDGVLMVQYGSAGLTGLAFGGHNNSFMQLAYNAIFAKKLGVNNTLVLDFNQIGTSDASNQMSISIAAQGLNGKSTRQTMLVSEGTKKSVSFDLGNMDSIVNLSILIGGNSLNNDGQTNLHTQLATISSISIKYDTPPPVIFTPPTTPTVPITSVPEPESALLTVAGIGISLLSRRKRRQTS